MDIVSGEIVLAGTYDASTNLVASVTPKGTSIGLTVGQPLIAPAASNSNHYLTVSQSGTGSGNAPAVALAPPDFLLSTGTAWEVLDLSTALAATAANNVSFAPAGNISASNVQAAIQELDTEKASLAGPTFTGTTTFSGDVLLGTSATLTFEGSSADDYETSFTFTNPTADRAIAFPDASGTVVLTGTTGTVSNAMLAGSIALTKLANLTSGQLIVGNGSNVPTAVTLSGDATISNTGALTIANDAVTADKLANTSVTAASYTNASITVDAQGRITAASNGSAAGIADIQADSTPQLGGNLDVNGNDIVSTSNGDIDLDPNGSGHVVFKGNSTRGSGAIKLNCEQNSHGIVVQGPPHSAAASYTLTLPDDDGTNEQVLQTDGSGALSWATPVKLGSAQTFSAAQTFTAQSVHNGGVKLDGPYEQVAEAVSALDIDLNDGNYFTKTINGNSTFTFSNPPSSGTVGSFVLELTHTSGTVTWPSSVKFPADTAPTLTTGKTHLFFFVTDDGGTRYRGASLVDYVN